MAIFKKQSKSENEFKDIIFINPDNLENTMIPEGHNLRHDRKRLSAKLSFDDMARK